MEHPKTSRKISKSIRQDEKVSQVSDDGKSSNSLLYSETTKRQKAITYAKIIKQ